MECTWDFGGAVEVITYGTYGGTILFYSEEALELW